MNPAHTDWDGKKRHARNERAQTTLNSKIAAFPFPNRWKKAAHTAIAAQTASSFPAKNTRRYCHTVRAKGRFRKGSMDWTNRPRSPNPMTAALQRMLLP